MNLNRLFVCQEVDERLTQLQGKLKLRPNLICRIGFCLSLNDPTVPDPSAYPPDSKRELNRSTLMGQWDDYFVALLRERCAHDKLNLETDLADQYRAHVNRGVLMVNHRMKNISDVGRLVKEVTASHAKHAESTT